MFFLAGLLYRYAPLVRESMGCSGGCREAGALIRRSTSGAAYAFTPALRPQSERLLTYTSTLHICKPRHPTSGRLSYQRLPTMACPWNYST
jgi:hypothetical protein